MKHRQPRSRICPVRFTVTEWAAIQREANEVGLKFSAFVRLAALDRARQPGPAIFADPLRATDESPPQTAAAANPQD